MACRALNARRERGQALLEITISSIVLVPLLLCGILLAQMQSLQHATIAATRQLALESFHRSMASDEQIRAAHFLPFDPLVDSIALQRLLAEQPEKLREAEAIVFGAIAPAMLVGQGSFDLARDSALSGQIEVRLKASALLPRWLDLPALALREQMTLLLDDWSATGPQQVLARTAALSVAGSLRELTEPLDPVLWAMSIVEPAFSRLCIGRIDPEIVPADRLPEAATRQSDLRTQECN